MYYYNPATFLQSIDSDSKVIIVRDITLQNKTQINPWDLKSSHISDNKLVLKFEDSNDMTLEFSTSADAITAIQAFQVQVDQIKGQSPNIDKSIIDYIETQIGASTDKNYVFRQESAATLWVINEHGLDKKPNVTVTDDNFNVIHTSVRYLDNNNIYVQSNQAITGWVFLN